MAPSWVLLDRDLSFSHDEAAFAGETKGGRESTKIKGPPSEEDYEDAITAYLRSLKPDARLANPPELSSLVILQPTKSVPPLCDPVTSAHISSADKHLVALYAGSYRPGTHDRGCHLIYDASKNSLSTIPRLPFREFHSAIGCYSAVVMCDGNGAGYTLAELTRVKGSDVGQAALYLWYPSAKEWVVKEGNLPHEVCPPTFDFSVGMCFHHRGYLCWVDLRKGMVVCDLSHVQRYGSDPKFRFVKLPNECPTYGVRDRLGGQICGEEFRSMSSVGGFIKFVTMDGYVDRRPGEEKLTLWTLSPDFSGWAPSKEYDLENIWASGIYQSTCMGKIPPSFPVLSVNEDNVVYLVFTDIMVVVNDLNGIRDEANNEVECRGQYLIRVDMENSKIQYHQASTEWIIHSQLFASEFSAYQQEDQSGGRSKRATASGKRIKL